MSMQTDFEFRVLTGAVWVITYEVKETESQIIGDAVKYKQTTTWVLAITPHYWRYQT